MGCLRFLEVNDTYTFTDCISRNYVRYYPLEEAEVSFSLSNCNIDINWCNIRHNTQRIISNTGREIDCFYHTSISWRIIKARTRPPINLSGVKFNTDTTCECPPNHCEIPCANSQNGFCCIPHSLNDRLLQIIKS